MGLLGALSRVSGQLENVYSYLGTLEIRNRYGIFASAAPANYTTTNSYVDVPGSETDISNYPDWGLTVKNTHGTNGITVQVLVSYDTGTTYVIVAADQAVTAGAIYKFDSLVSGYRAADRVKIQAKSSVADTAGTTQVRIGMKR